MILKDIDKKSNPTKAQKFGDKAENQMAHYLMRAYQKSEDIHVINDLRIERKEDAAQIDHLIIHKFGFIIVESKSVTGKISINDNSEWTRQYGAKSTGMPSPIKQAQRQSEFLEAFLNHNSENLLKKRLIFKSSMSNFKFDILVAISNDGIINRAKKSKTNEAFKADQITDAINKIIAKHKGANYFSDSSMDKITRFLKISHTPRKKINEIAEEKANYTVKPISKKQPNIIKASVENTVVSCSKCNSKNIGITYGPHGYYFKCDDCDGNTSIKLKCKTASCEHRLRKSKQDFYHECSSCDTSNLYFRNKATEKA